MTLRYTYTDNAIKHDNNNYQTSNSRTTDIIKLKFIRNDQIKYYDFMWNATIASGLCKNNNIIMHIFQCLYIGNV